MIAVLRYMVVVVVCLLPGIVNAERFGIAVVVGDQAISTKDVEERLRIALSSAGVQDSPEVRHKLMPQVLRVLIDEKLIEIEAKRSGIKIPANEMSAALRSLEVKNKLEEGTFQSFIEDQGLSFEGVKAQLQVQLLRTRLVNRKVRPLIRVTDREIEEKMEHISAETGIEEFDVAEIVLPFTDEESEQSMRKLAVRIQADLKDGNNFGSLARAFSRSESASKGGALGWVESTEFAKPIQVAVKNLLAGSYTSPIVVGNRIYIMQLKARRALIGAREEETEVGFKYLRVATNDSQKQEAIQKLESAKQAVSSCDAFDGLAKQVGSLVEPEMRMSQLRSLPVEIKQIIGDSQVGIPSSVIEKQDALELYIVCERIEASSTLAQRAKVKESIEQQKLQLQTKRFLRDLRRNTFVEIRI